MRIAAINQFYWPDLAATSQLLTDLCEHLAAVGHDVHVVCGRGHYAGGHAALPHKELHAGVHIHRAWTANLGKASLLHRGADYASFHATATAQLMALPHPDVVLCLSTPPLVASLGMMAKAVRGSRFIYWVQDLYPDVAVELGALRRDSNMARSTAAFSRQILTRADAVVALGDAMRAQLTAHGAPVEKVHVVHNWADGHRILPTPVQDNKLREGWAERDRFCVMYSGNFGLAHDFDTLEHAFTQLGRRDDILFALVGDGVRKAPLEQGMRARGAVNLRFWPLFPREQLSHSLGAADVHLISLHPRLSGMVVPSKVYGVMAAGRPSVFVGPPESDVWRLLEESGAGLCVRNGDGPGLVDALMRLKDDVALRERMGLKARETFMARYDQPHALRAFERIITGAPVVQHPATRAPQGAKAVSVASGSDG
ncbi:MAG: glycosyltransferase family 4 protein [Myxococcota bacterium]